MEEGSGSLASNHQEGGRGWEHTFPSLILQQHVEMGYIIMLGDGWPIFHAVAHATPIRCITCR